MATARFLFNDFFHDRPGRQSWALRTQGGNTKTPTEIFATLHNGKLDSVEEFSDPMVGAELIQFFHNTSSEFGDAVGLINNTFGGMVMNTLNAPARVISSGNFLYNEPNNAPFTDIFINVANDATSGYISAVFVGHIHDIEVWYPEGWELPMCSPLPTGFGCLVKACRLVATVSLRRLI